MKHFFVYGEYTTDTNIRNEFSGRVMLSTPFSSKNFMKDILEIIHKELKNTAEEPFIIIKQLTPFGEEMRYQDFLDKTAADGDDIESIVDILHDNGDLYELFETGSLTWNGYTFSIQVSVEE